MQAGQAVKLVLGFVIVLFVLFGVGKIVEFQDAQELMVVQYPNGTLAWFTEPGPHGQWLGRVVKYDRRFQYEFLAPKDPKEKGTPEDRSIKIRFNDRAHAQLSGSIAVELPLEREKLSAIHAKYGTQETLIRELIGPVIEKAVYMTGPLMSSTESSAERRNELLNLVEDQIDLGVYRTKTEQIKEPDPMTGTLKTVNIVRLVADDKGNILRQDHSPLQEFGIKTFNLSLNEIDYEDTVEKQIAEQQKAVMEVQTAMANAKKAEQDAITAEKDGQAKAAKAKWEQEALKATAVTKAEQELAVAELDRKKAEQERLANILRGQGEAERRKLIMAADNALDARLEATVKINELWAKAFENAKSPLVPTVVMGSQNGKSGSGQTVLDLIQLMAAEKAHETGARLAAPTAGAAGKTN